MKQQLISSLFICFCYALCSMGFNFSAKFLFRIFAFHNTFIMLFYEVSINIIICTLITLWQKRKNAISLFNNGFKFNTGLMIQMIIKERIKSTLTTLPYSLVYGTGVYCGMTALSKLNIPMFLALRRTLIFFVFCASLVIGDGKTTISLSLGTSILLITSGAILAGYHKLNDNLLGYALVIFNNCLSATGLYLARNLNISHQLSPLELVYNNSLNLWPVFLFLSVVSGDLQSFLEFQALYDTEFLISLTIVAFMGFSLNYCTNVCTMRLSPFAIALTHNIKDMFSTSLSILLFSDLTVDRALIGGIGLSFCGSFFYSYTKIQDLRKEDRISQQNEKDDLIKRRENEEQYSLEMVKLNILESQSPQKL